MTPALRAEQLIALACSTTHEEEARTAALAAARLIQREGLCIAAKAVEPRIVRNRRPSVSAEPPDPDDWFWERMRRREHERRRSEKPPAKAPPQGVWRDCLGATLRCHECGAHIEDGERYYEGRTSEFGREVWCAGH